MTDDFGLDLPLLHAGKVRRLYDLPDADGAGRMLMVATDNISAFDFVLRSRIPDKGAILNQLSLWWFDKLADVIENHVVSTDVPDAVTGRAVVVEKLAMVPVEAVARGYLTGSGWAEYQQSGTVGGVVIPDGLRDGDRLPEPLFTPAVKAPLGEHDENVDFPTIVALHGEAVATALRDATLALYARAERVAGERGIILADTKFEFGFRADGTLVLADEPTGELDAATGLEMIDLFRRLNRDGTTIVVVTHDAQMADAAQRRIQMRDGTIISGGLA